MINTAIEETVHGYQHDLMIKYHDDQIDPTDPRFHQAEIFTISSYNYYPGHLDRMDKYWSNPSEVDAKSTSRQITGQLR